MSTVFGIAHESVFCTMSTVQQALRHLIFNIFVISYVDHVQNSTRRALLPGYGRPFAPEYQKAREAYLTRSHTDSKE